LRWPNHHHRGAASLEKLLKPSVESRRIHPWVSAMFFWWSYNVELTKK
jgi:hypothetical protein